MRGFLRASMGEPGTQASSARERIDDFILEEAPEPTARLLAANCDRGRPRAKRPLTAS